MSFDYWKLTTVVLAVFAAYIAYQQYRLGREKFKLDLFEKRFTVFSGTRLLLTSISQKGNLKNPILLQEYRATIVEATFLFDEELTKYLKEIYDHAVDLHTEQESLNNLRWLTHQTPELENRFAPYMKFRIWR